MTGIRAQWGKRVDGVVTNGVDRLSSQAIGGSTCAARCRKQMCFSNGVECRNRHEKVTAGAHRQAHPSNPGQPSERQTISPVAFVGKLSRDQRRLATP